MRRVWPWVRDGLALVGALVLACFAYVNAVRWYESEVAPPVVMAKPPVSDTARKIAGWVSPPLVRFALEEQERFVRRVPNRITRWAVGVGYPYAVRAIPTGAEVGADVALDRFGSMPMRDLADLVVSHQRSKGRFAHWTVHEAAERPVGATIVP